MQIKRNAVNANVEAIGREREREREKMRDIDMLLMMSE